MQMKTMTNIDVLLVKYIETIGMNTLRYFIEPYFY